MADPAGDDAIGADALTLPANATPADYWDLARTLSLVGDTLVSLDAQGARSPLSPWRGRATRARVVGNSPCAEASSSTTAAPRRPRPWRKILGALHPAWNVRASADAISIETEPATPSLLAELALRAISFSSATRMAFQSAPGLFLVADWQPAKLLKLAANEDSWEGRPFVDAVEIEFGKSPHDQAIALELDKTD